MKKLFLILVLLAGTGKAEHAFGQQKPGNNFEIADEKFRWQFLVDLGRHNNMKLELTAIQDLAYLHNIDSILKNFLNELAMLKDSISADAASHRIDYVIDNPALKTLRIQQSGAVRNYYAFISGAPVVLKMEQDTVVISGKIVQSSGKKNQSHYFRIHFFLDDLDDLNAYKDGRLNDKIRQIEQHYRGRWEYLEDGRLALKNYPDISSNTAYGRIFQTKLVRLRLSADIQNYKDHFVPSLTGGILFIIERDYLNRCFGLTAESHFIFEKSGTGASTARPNIFIAAYYEVQALQGYNLKSKIRPSINVAYLIKRKSELYDKYTCRLGLGGVVFFKNKSVLQPVIYFNKFFQHITPGIRFSQNF